MDSDPNEEQLPAARFPFPQRREETDSQNKGPYSPEPDFDPYAIMADRKFKRQPHGLRRPNHKNSLDANEQIAGIVLGQLLFHRMISYSDVVDRDGQGLLDIYETISQAIIDGLMEVDLVEIRDLHYGRQP